MPTPNEKLALLIDDIAKWEPRDDNEPDRQKQKLFRLMDVHLIESLPELRTAISDGKLGIAFLIDYLDTDLYRCEKIFKDCSREILEGFIVFCVKELANSNFELSLRFFGRIGFIMALNQPLSQDDYKKLFGPLTFLSINQAKNNTLPNEFFAWAKHFLSHIDDINFVDAAGNSTLHVALSVQTSHFMFKHNSEFVKYLLDKDSNITLANHKNETPLELAANYNNVPWEQCNLKTILDRNPNIKHDILERSLARFINTTRTCNEYPTSLQSNANFKALFDRVNVNPSWDKVTFFATRLDWSPTSNNSKFLINLLAYANVSVADFFKALSKSKPEVMIPLIEFIINNGSNDQNDTLNIFHYLAQEPQLCADLNADNRLARSLSNRLDGAARNAEIISLAIRTKTTKALQCPLEKAAENNNLEYILLMLNSYIPNLPSTLDTDIQAKMRVTLLRMTERGVDVKPITSYLKTYQASKFILNRNLGFRPNLLKEMKSTVPSAVMVNDKECKTTKHSPANLKQ